MLELDEDVEGMQSTIYYLQQQLREAKEKIFQLKLEKQKGIPNGSSARRHIAHEESMDTDSQSSHLQSSSFVKNEPGSPASVSNELNGTEKLLPIEIKDIKLERPWSPAAKQMADTTFVELPKKSISNETSVILSPKDIKQEPKISPEKIIQSVIVENKNAINHDKQIPSVERINHLVDSLETNKLSDLRTSDRTCEITGASEVAHNSTSTVKRRSEGGRGRKRTRSRTPVEPVQKKEQLPVRKRTRRGREVKAIEEKKQFKLEIDTDTEVQVAQTLAYWATAKQERTEVQSDPNSSVGNGELTKKRNQDK